MDVVSICAVNYLPFVQVLGDSFLKHNQNSDFYVLVVDGQDKNFEIDKRFKVLFPKDLPLDIDTFEKMSLYYNVTELSTALKPYALKKLFQIGCTKVAYLDPDIQVFSPLTEISRVLDDAPIVLTPHTLNPIPRDGLRPDESDIMGSGVFNLGFIALSNSNEAHYMLSWWQERLLTDSISDTAKNLFTDQRWIDLVPSYFNYFCYRSPAANVAYWNLHERRLSKGPTSYLVDDIPLEFFHFSGYRPDKPWILSKYVIDNPRILISSDSVLQELCASYGDAAEASGWRNEESTPYFFDTLSDGTFITNSMRRIYRDLVISQNAGTLTEIPNPYDFTQWLKTRSELSGKLNRIMHQLWSSRADLRNAFPDATNNPNAFIKWAFKYGIQEKAITKDFIATEERENSPEKYENTKGLNVAGYFKGEFGVGQSGRIILETAVNTGLPVRTLLNQSTTSRQLENYSEISSSNFYPLTISVVNADQFEIWMDQLDPEIVKKSRIIGVWAWEIEDFPTRLFSAFDYVDEIWAVSEFVKLAIEKHTNVTVQVFPTPIVAPRVIETLDRSTVGLETDSIYNLFIFDFLSVFNRKNPLAVIHAHTLAFPNMDGPKLVIKSSNGSKYAGFAERMKFEAKDRSDVVFVDDYLSREQITALINECSTYISLHRSEGYGLTIAEAMSLGKPVVVTGYSGNMDFCTPENALLVPFELIEIGFDSFPYPPKSKWAEPNVNVAAEYLIKLHRDRDFASEIGSRAKAHVAQKFTAERASEFIKSRAEVNLNKNIKIHRLLKQIKKNSRTQVSKIKQIIKIISS